MYLWEESFESICCKHHDIAVATYHLVWVRFAIVPLLVCLCRDVHRKGDAVFLNFIAVILRYVAYAAI